MSRDASEIDKRRFASQNDMAISFNSVSSSCVRLPWFLEWRQRSVRKCPLWLLLSLALIQGSAGQSLPAQDVDGKTLPPAGLVQVDFRRDTEPLLKEKCQSCHGAHQQLSGLRLDSRNAALAGGNRGVAIKPGNSQESRLIHVVA